MNATCVGIDLAKSVFEVAVSRTPGRVDTRQGLPRSRMHTFFAQHESAEIVMESCGSAHIGAANSRRWVTASRCSTPAT